MPIHTRDYNRYEAANNSSCFNAMKVPAGNGTGNVFVGGMGAVSVVNQTENFTCLGEMSNMSVVNRGNNAYIQGGIQGNTVISVGHNCTITGSDKDDEIISIGENCNISTLGGIDRICASGAGTIVDGGDGDDIGSGTLGGLTYDSLYKLDAMSMLAKIRQTSLKWLLK